LDFGFPQTFFGWFHCRHGNKCKGIQPRSIETNNLAGLRDRVVLGLMVFAFVRVSAALRGQRRGPVPPKKRLWVRLHEKGGRVHDMPNHTLEEYLSNYLEAAILPDRPPPPCSSPLSADHMVAARRS
jgi:hypothetical protein